VMSAASLGSIMSAAGHGVVMSSGSSGSRPGVRTAVQAVAVAGLTLVALRVLLPRRPEGGR
jgi:hypothetical protein